MKEKLLAIINKLKLGKEAKEGALTTEHWDKIAKAFKEEYGEDPKMTANN